MIMNKLLLFSVFSMRNSMTMFSLEKFGAALTNSVCVTAV